MAHAGRHNFIQAWFGVSLSAAEGLFLSVYGSVAHLFERPIGEPQAKPYPDVVPWILLSRIVSPDSLKWDP